MIKNYFKIAWRNLVKHRLTSLINIIGLSTGLTCCIIIFLFVKYESTFDAFHPNYENTYRIVQHTTFQNHTAYWNTTPYPLAEALRNDFPEIDNITQIAGPTRGIFSLGEGNEENAAFEDDAVFFVNPSFPEVFDVAWIAGNPKTALQNEQSIVLTQSIAEKYFGKNFSTTHILGQTLTINNKDLLQITGLVKDPPPNTSLRYRILIPYSYFRKENPGLAGNWMANHQGSTYVVLDSKKRKENLESKIETWKSRYLKPEDGARISYVLQPLSEIHTETLYGNNIGGYTMPRKVLIFSSAVGIFILFLALINFINLSTAQSLSRSKEVGIRKVLGGSRRSLTRQFLFENGLLVSIVVLLSIGLSHFLIIGINDFLSVIDMELALHWNEIIWVVLAGGIIVLLAALFPALRISSYSPIEALKDKINLSVNKHNLRLKSSLTVVQFVIVQVLVIATIVVAFQMNHFRNSDLGFTSDNALVIPNPEPDKMEVFRQTLLKESSISNVAFGSGPPMAVEGISLGTSFRLPQENKEEGTEAEIKIGDANYLDLFDLQLLAGRNFNTAPGGFEFIVNEKLAATKGWKPEEAIGQQIEINEGVGIIVGVVSNYHNNSLQHSITPNIITNWNFLLNNTFLKMTDIGPESMANIEESFKTTFPSATFEFHFLDDSIKKEYMLEKSIFNAFKLLASLAILIACLGLYGFMAFITASKTKEIGIRKMLGSSISDILLFFSKEYMILIGLSFLVATPLVYYAMEQWLQNFSYRIELSPVMFIAGGLITFFTAVCASSYQLVKAATANPIKCLRTE